MISRGNSYLPARWYVSLLNGQREVVNNHPRILSGWYWYQYLVGGGTSTTTAARYMGVLYIQHLPPPGTRTYVPLLAAAQVTILCGDRLISSYSSDPPPLRALNILYWYQVRVL